MKQGKVLTIVALVFVLVMGGASLLYHRLSAEFLPDQLSASEETKEEESDLTPAPDFTAYDAEGNEVKLSDYIGKPLVLNFWASWCGPCKMEMPHFEDAYLEQGEEVQFLMVNMTTSSRETLEAAQSYVAEEAFTFPVLYDRDSDAATVYGVYSLPTTYFVDEEGNLTARAAGAIDAETLQKGIDLITE